VIPQKVTRLPSDLCRAVCHFLAGIIGLGMSESPTVKTSCQFLVSLASHFLQAIS